MNRFRLATWATLVGVSLAAGCASPCGCGGPLFQRMSLFRPRLRGCPCETCGCGGGLPATSGGAVISDGPLLGEPPGGVALPGGVAPPGPPLMQSGPPGPLPPSLGAPTGPPMVPSPDGRIFPTPNAAQPVPAESSSRRKR